MFGKRHLFLAGLIGFIAAYVLIAVEFKLAIRSLKSGANLTRSLN